MYSLIVDFANYNEGLNLIILPIYTTSSLPYKSPNSIAFFLGVAFNFEFVALLVFFLTLFSTFVAIFPPMFSWSYIHYPQHLMAFVIQSLHLLKQIMKRLKITQNCTC